jgi:REP element-mobilizing transposase RayT
MTASILVATPHAPFGELLRISLEEDVRYQVSLVASAAEARAAVQQADRFAMAIVDSTLAGEPFASLCADLLRAQHEMRLVLIPPENNPNHPSLGGLMPHGYLSRPFYLPDLMHLTARLVKDYESALRREAGGGLGAQPAPLPPWLAEPLALSQTLETQLSGAAALGGVVVNVTQQTGSNALHAQAGALNGEAGAELAGLVFRYWNRADATDLLRFVRLSADKHDYLIYATQVTPGLALALAFDPASPLSQIRPRTRAAAQALAPRQASAASEALAGAASEAPAGEAPAEVVSEARELAVEPEENTSAPSAEVFGADADEAEAVPEMPVPAAVEPFTQPNRVPAVYDDDIDFDDEALVINLAALLGTIPSPDPENGTLRRRPADGVEENVTGLNGGWVHVESAPQEVAPQEVAAGQEVPAAGETLARAGQEVAPQEWRAPQEVSAAGEALAGAGQEVAPQEWRAPQEVAAAGEGPVDAGITRPRGVDWSEPPVDPLEDTQPRMPAAQTIGPAGQLPPLAMLHYTCVLMPRMAHHHLVGELAEAVSQWVGQLCAAFGWRLEGISVRPEYLQWSVQVPPSVSPGSLVRALRQRTSLNIFTAYPALAEGSPEGDFWAPGYLIVAGPQPPSTQLLHDYILQSRLRAGASASRSHP